MGFKDLGEVPRPPWAILGKVEQEIRKLLTEIKPDVVITWGPDGGYGHPDHRLVGSVVTTLVQQGEDVPKHLLYVGVPKGRVPLPPETGELAELPFSAVDLRYLTVRVPYDEQDLKAATRAFACYKSQFLPVTLESGVRDMDSKVWQGRVYFRPWFGATVGDDLFTLSP
jgi:LmbE family N-acetylglucosaminyl deacetylase